jgi:hypothetical protein
VRDDYQEIAFRCGLTGPFSPGAPGLLEATVDRLVR